MALLHRRSRLCILVLLLQSLAHSLSLQTKQSSCISRTAFVRAVLIASPIATTMRASPAYANSASSQADIQKLEEGYNRLDYLVNNFEKETTICGRSDNPYIGLCERNPLKVMEYMGYKSTKDPLFQAEKTMIKLQSLVPSDRTSDYIDAIEQWTQAAQDASGLAYVSSWGESNPGGGKDRVAYYIERSRKDVVGARDALKVIVEILRKD